MRTVGMKSLRGWGCGSSGGSRLGRAQGQLVLLHLLHREGSRGQGCGSQSGGTFVDGRLRMFSVIVSVPLGHNEVKLATEDEVVLGGSERESTLRITRLMR